MIVVPVSLRNTCQSKVFPPQGAASREDDPVIRILLPRRESKVHHPITGSATTPRTLTSSRLLHPFSGASGTDRSLLSLPQFDTPM